jgi:hypothetical protein
VNTTRTPSQSHPTPQLLNLAYIHWWCYHHWIEMLWEKWLLFKNYCTGNVPICQVWEMGILSGVTSSVPMEAWNCCKALWHFYCFLGPLRESRCNICPPIVHHLCPRQGWRLIWGVGGRDRNRNDCKQNTWQCQRFADRGKVSWPNLEDTLLFGASVWSRQSKVAVYYWNV